MNKSANSDNGGVHQINGTIKKSLNVSIIGGGLVGSLAALYLARRGFQVDLFEYREDIRTSELVVGRSINLALSARGRKALAEVGLEKELLDHGIPMRGRMLHDLKGNYTIVPYDRNTNQCIYSVGRKYLNEILLNATENYTNIELHFNHKLVSSQFDDGILNFVQQTSGEKIQIKTDLIVGCDGAFSVVRRGMLSKPGFDFEQKYIEHGYIELCIPPTKDNDFAMPKNYLHIWPRGKFMMIALPNQDKTWTVTLFMPFKNFDDIRTIDHLVDFFKIYFPDSIALIGREKLINDFFKVKPQALISVKCRSYHYDSKVLLLGDAAHAVVPFYGQGMNAGFEDCTVLNDLLSKYSNNIGTTLEVFSESRWKDLHAISDLAMYNYVEMRDLVNRKTYRIRKYFDDFLYRLYPTKWIPLYNSVSFSYMPYKKCVENRKWQDKMITSLFYFIGVIVLGLFPLVIMNV